MSDELKVVDLAARRNSKKDEDKEAWKEEVKETFEVIQKAIEDGRLTQFILLFDEESTEEDKAKGAKDCHSQVLTWNKSGDIDKTLGNVSRLNIRLLLMAEGLIG